MNGRYIGIGLKKVISVDLYLLLDNFNHLCSIKGKIPPAFVSWGKRHYKYTLETNSTYALQYIWLTLQHYAYYLIWKM